MSDQSSLTTEQSQFEGLIQGLITKGYGWSDDFLEPQIILGLRDNIQSLFALKALKSAGVGNKEELHKNKLVRGDKIKWLEELSQDVFEKAFLTKIEHFILYLNKTCYTSINKFESHYANYDQKSFYRRHLDQFKNDKGRKFSVILYLNEDWLIGDGGNLSLYPKDGLPKDISPMGGRLVFFRSDELEHEVHPSYTRNRISIAGWFKG